MKCIQLLAITKSSVLQAYGADCILQNFMKDIKQLEQDAGVTFRINGTNYSFNGTLSLVPGDNLASQYLGGFKSLASAFRKCRQCMAIDSDMQCQFVSDTFEPRTRESHAVQCSSLGGPLHATTYGIHRDSILNQSRYFHVTEGLVPDVMHDVLEGALELEVKQLLKLFISKKCFSLSTLNDAIESFSYGGADTSNKPTPISPKTLASQDNLLKQSASQMWCLARLLPLLIGEHVAERDPHWENFLLLLSIVDYCLAPLISEDWPAYLRMIINDHHKEFKVLYPSFRLTPKMHYMIHYPEIMCQYGPLVRFWCMRFESKHNYFPDISEESMLTRLSWVEIKGATYKSGSAVVLGMEDVPKFGIVEDILVLQTDIYYLVCSVLVTECFSHHFHAFQTNKHHPEDFFICTQSSLYDTHVLAAYVISSNPSSIYVPLKYQLVENS